jgi:hypothetical protein
LISEMTETLNPPPASSRSCLASAKPRRYPVKYRSEPSPTPSPISEIPTTSPVLTQSAVQWERGLSWSWRAGGGVLGAVVSLDPGGFWTDWQRHFFYGSIWFSIRLVRLLQPVMPLTRSAVGRTLLFAQFAARPWKLPPKLMLDEMRSFALF